MRYLCWSFLGAVRVIEADSPEAAAEGYCVLLDPATDADGLAVGPVACIVTAEADGVARTFQVVPTVHVTYEAKPA